MPGLVPGIQVVSQLQCLRKRHHTPTWMAGTGPAMTEKAV